MPLQTDSAEVYLEPEDYSGSGNLLDSTGNGHHAVPAGSPSFSNGVFTMDGTNDEFVMPDAAGLDFADGEDFTFLIVVSQPTVAEGMIVDKSGGFGSGDDGYRLDIHGSLAPRGEIADGTTELSIVHATALQNGVTHVVGLRRDETAPDLHVFVDGVASSGDGTPSGDLSNALGLTIGRVSGGAEWWAGNFYAFALWRASLSTANIVIAGAEMTAHLASGLSGRMMLLGVG